MHLQNHFRPQAEALEDRYLPNNFFQQAGLGLLDLDAKASGADHPFAAVSAATADGDLSNPGVAPPQSHPHGASYAEWSARWWEYVYSIPADKNPLLDNGPNNAGGNFSVGQSGSVWYLAGTGAPFGTPASTTVTRNVTLPAGRAIFFPVFTVEVDNLNLTPGDPGFGTQNMGFTVDQMRALAKDVVNNAILTASVDGKPINNLNLYRVTSPVFSYTLGPNNVVSAMTGQTVPPQTVSPAVADGVYLMLAPLSVGPHTINFTGAAPAFSFSLNVTYNITVTPGKA